MPCHHRIGQAERASTGRLPFASAACARCSARQLQHGAIVDRRRPALQPMLALGAQLVFGLEAGIQPARMLQSFRRRRILLQPVATGGSCRCRSSPSQRRSRAIASANSSRGAFQIGVVDAQDEASTLVAGEQVVGQRGARVADMQQPGRARCETNGDHAGSGLPHRHRPSRSGSRARQSRSSGPARRSAKSPKFGRRCASRPRRRRSPRHPRRTRTTPPAPAWCPCRARGTAPLIPHVARGRRRWRASAWEIRRFPRRHCHRRHPTNRGCGHANHPPGQTDRSSPRARDATAANQRAALVPDGVGG